MKRKRNISIFCLHIVLLLGACVMMMPFVWMVLTSFKTVTEATSMNPFHFFS